MAKIIIGIHGLGNKPDPDLLEKWWLISIIEGLSKKDIILKKIPFKLIYWADILHPKPENPDISDKDDLLFLSEPYIPSTSKKNEKPAAKRFYMKILKFIERQLDNIFLRKDMTLKFRKVTDHLIHKYFQDLGVYYSDKCMDQNNPECIARHSIRERLSEALKNHINDEILLLSHSMGSIIAYDVLMNKKDSNVKTLVTLGSPLGIPMVESRIFAEHKSLRVPENISDKWLNLSDPEDLVAMDHKLRDDFLENQNMLKVQDSLIYNDYKVNEKRNPHKIYGYLRAPEVTQIIIDFLKVEESAFIKHYNKIKNRIIKLWKTKILRRKK